MKKILLVVGVFFIAFSCSQKANENNAKNEGEMLHQQETSDNHKEVKANTAMSAEISGMSCVMACGSSIKKELYSLGGVSKVEFDDFNEENEFNKIKVYYDDNAVSEDDLILAITTLESHKYGLENPHSEKIGK